MTVQEIHGQLRTRFGEAVGPLSEPKIDPFCLVACARLLEVSAFLRDGEGLELDFLQDLTAIDWPARSVIELVYHLYSFTHRHGIVLKVEADRAVPVVPSLEGIWKAANFLEREVYDLFGVTFTGHPDLRRILLPDDWVGHPLRKDYQEAGGYHRVSNERPDPLVELRRLDVKRIAEQTKPKPGDTPSGN